MAGSTSVECLRKVSRNQRMPYCASTNATQKPSEQGIHFGFPLRIRLYSALAATGCSLRLRCADAAGWCLRRSWWFARYQAGLGSSGLRLTTCR